MADVSGEIGDVRGEHERGVEEVNVGAEGADYWVEPGEKDAVEGGVA